MIHQGMVGFLVESFMPIRELSIGRELVGDPSYTKSFWNFAGSKIQ